MFNVLDKTAPRDSSRPSGLVRLSSLLPISLLILSSFTALAAPRAAQQPDGTERLVFDLTQTLETPPQLEQDPNQLRFQLEGLPTEQGFLNLPRVRGFSVSGNTVTLEGIFNKPVQAQVLPGSSGVGSRLLLDLPPTHTPEHCWKPQAALERILAAEPPSVLSGKVGLVIAQLDAKGRFKRILARDENTVFPLASAYKQLLAFQALERVHKGEWKLSDTLESTPQNRSIEGYSKGKNTLETLLKRTLEDSENTAADLIHLRLGLEQPQTFVDALKLCSTRILLTTKAFWTAEAGWGGPDFTLPNPLEAARRFHFSRGEERLALARSIKDASFKRTGPQLEAALEKYFEGPAYNPDLDLFTQNVSTPLEFAHLLSTLYPSSSLGKQNLLFRKLASLSCCKPPVPKLHYWGGKAGSGWRILTLSGYLERTDGSRFVYALFNFGSKLDHAEKLEDQIPLALKYLAGQLERMR
ncbi:MAG: serine hydrolase [Pseudopedobacter sp.]|nr:serine hydrolase [Deinococcales bacterium]